MGVTDPHRPSDGPPRQEGIPAGVGQESATQTHTVQDLILDLDLQRHDHARIRRGLGVEAQAGETEQDSRAESHDRQCEEGEGEVPVTLAIPATVTEVVAEVEAGMGEAETNLIVCVRFWAQIGGECMERFKDLVGCMRWIRLYYYINEGVRFAHLQTFLRHRQCKQCRQCRPCKQRK